MDRQPSKNFFTTLPTVIIGAGFTGLFTALHLRNQNYLCDLILIDPQKQFVFKPMLYELLTEELPEKVVCPDYAELLQGSDINFVEDRVVKLDLQQKQLELATGHSYSYRYLVLAIGSSQGYLGTEGARENAFAFRSRQEALTLRQHLQTCLQRAREIEEREDGDGESKKSLLTFVIVGAGPSGVEMAATLADLLPYWYARLGGNIHEIKIILINHADRILAGDANSHLQQEALQALQQRTIPVELRLGVSVKSVSSDRLTYQNKDREEVLSLPTQTTIWTAGTANNPLLESISAQIPSEHINRHGQPVVSQTLQLLDFPEVFAAGDCVQVQDQNQPALAQVAYQQGAAIAHNLMALSQNHPLQISNAQLRGTLMKLGLGNGVANLFDKVQIHGKVGDLIRNATYLEMLPTPLHDFKATAIWLEEETFNRYHHPLPLSPEQLQTLKLTPAEQKERLWVKVLAVVTPLILAIAAYVSLQTPPNERFPIPQQNQQTQPPR